MSDPAAPLALANRPIAALMQRHVFSIGMDDSLEQIETLFGERELSWAPVVEGGAMIGVISSADLVRLRAQRPDATAPRAWQLCTYRPATVSSDTPVGAVARLMVARHIHHVVVTEADTMVGVVSSLDFVRAIADGAVP